MHLTHAPQRLLALLAAAILALPVSAAPASAAQAPERLDDEVTQRLLTTAESQRIPVIIEGAPDRGAQTSGANRAQRAEDRVRSSGGHVIGTSSLLGASVAELTPAEIRTLATDPSVGRIHIDTEVTATAVGAADSSTSGATPIVFQQTIGAPDAWQAGDTGQKVTVAVLDTGIDNNNAAFGARVKARVDFIDPAHPAQGDPAVGGYREDPLAAAAELAWQSGLVLVTAAGNSGPGAGTIQTPGIDPLVLTVGASDDNGTAAPSDDSIPSWSSVGPTADGLAKPDLVAPGRKIVSVRVPGSTLDLQSPSHVEGPTTIRFSGTSEATAVAAGAAALLINQRPELSPDQAKALLVSAARPLHGVSAAPQGAGLINVPRALAARTPHVTRPHLPPADGVIRALLPTLQREFGNDQGGNEGDNAHGNMVQGDHVLWDHVLWDHVLWDHVLWDHVLWDHVLWDHVLWDHVLWDHVLWDQTV